MGAVRAAAGRKPRKEYRRSGDGRGGEGGPGVRVSAGRRHGDGRVGPRVRLQGANSSESLGGRDGGKAISEVGVWAPERSRPSVAESDVGSAFSAPDVYGEDSFLIEDLVVRLDPFLLQQYPCLPLFTSVMCRMLETQQVSAAHKCGVAEISSPESHLMFACCIG